MNTDNIIVKIARSEAELEQIHQLNYDTFVDEINQHKPNESKALIDQHDGENIYYVAKLNDELIGMLAFRDKRPFSLDKKIDNIDTLLPSYSNIVEIRLLSIKKQYRSSKVLLKLLQYIINDDLDRSYDLAVISGILKQKRLYEHLGFQKFGPPVGKGVMFQPMYLTKQKYLDVTTRLSKPRKTLNLLPGPVAIDSRVREAFSQKPISHRSTKFKSAFERVRKNLLELTSAKYVEVFTGTGTTANDTIAGQLSLLSQTGLILSNGEFGERLFKHADNFKLKYIKRKTEWGVEYSFAEIEDMLKKTKIKWLWLVHHETSTGMINNLENLSELCKKYGVKICVDAISSLGTQRVNLSEVYLASSVSSKGLASYSGLSIIFYNHDIGKQQQLLPTNINLSVFSQSDGIPFTLSSNLIFALDVSLRNIDNLDAHILGIKDVSDKLRAALEEKGISILVNRDKASYSTMTLPLREDQDSVQVGQKLKQNNILVSFESNYLVKRNWIQICLMGTNHVYEEVKSILRYL